jgi:aspartokinase/homoserine dehydrogenase 1
VTEKSWKIHKFGGSSLASADCFKGVAKILLGYDDLRIGVVVSAMGGMTDALINLTLLAEQNNNDFVKALDSIGKRYLETAGSLLEDNIYSSIFDEWNKDANDITDLLNSIALVKSAHQRNRDMVAGYGEIWSARLLSAYLGQVKPSIASTWVDARNIIVVKDNELGPTVLWPESQHNLNSEIDSNFNGIAVITGFIAADEAGLQTTLGRNGSDHSASIFAALFKASLLTIWTDVDGVMSADPRLVPEAQVINCLTYNEAMELAYFGAKVIHPQTLGPAVENNIPVVIRNTFNIAHPGSRIEQELTTSGKIKGITAIGEMSLINLEGSGMIGVPGTADRLFTSLKVAGVSVTLISQASSEHSICIAVPEKVSTKAHNVISSVFSDELKSGQIQSVDITSGQSIVAVVGDGMAGSPGLAAKFFGTLARAGVNINAIAQGSSERNISVVVDSNEVTKALRSSHSGFYLSAKTISIGLIGPGTVGDTLLRQIEKQSDKLAKEFNLDLRVRAISRSKNMLLSDKRINLASWKEEFEKSAIDKNFDDFVKHLKPDHLPHAVIIDCTASDEISSFYRDWLSRGIHVITPNKKAFSDSFEIYKELQKAANEGGSHYFYETTVGAALPVISTLCDLIKTGDGVRSIQGILSGTLAYLFNVYDGKTPFSEIVKSAKISGYTEPDPREDLSGMDVARKLTILARELGQEIEIGEFPVKNLVPEALRDCSVEEFLEKFSDYDQEIDSLFKKAIKDGKKLRYVAKLDAEGNASVDLVPIADAHAFCNINLTDNIVQFETERYSANPLVIQGPGAGPEVTAAGVFADLLRLANFLDKGENYV